MVVVTIVVPPIDAFGNDAAHALRTPLTIVRGHLQLLEADPAERAETIRLVMDELTRMGRLIDDLLLLAHAEQPDFWTSHASQSGSSPTRSASGPRTSARGGGGWTTLPLPRSTLTATG